MKDKQEETPCKKIKLSADGEKPNFDCVVPKKVRRSKFLVFRNIHL